MLHKDRYKDDAIISEYQEIIRKQKAKIVQSILDIDAVQGLSLMADMGFITCQNIDANFLNPAIEQKAAKCQAFLAEWKSKNKIVQPAPKKSKQKNETDKDPFSAAEMKKLWSSEKLPDGTLCIKHYKGNDTCVKIPPRIGKLPVTAIAAEAFREQKITSVVIPEGVTSIGEEAFAECNLLEKLFIPESIVSIGDGAFRGCTRLADSNGFVIAKNIVFDYLGSGGDVCIPDETTVIDSYAFYNHKEITSVTLPKGVISIKANAFRGCKGLADAEGFVIVNDILFDYCGAKKKVAIPEGVTTIGDDAFSFYHKMTSVTIPESVISIEKSAFFDCVNLSSVTIPESVIAINKSAFFDCINLSSVFLSEQTAVGPAAFKGCRQLADEKGFVTINNILYDYRGSASKLEIPEGITVISDRACEHCRAVEITIPKTVTSIGRDAFSMCEKLRSVVISEGVATIDDGAFRYCNDLEKVYIPQSVTFIDDGTFSKTKKITFFVLAGSYAERYAQEKNIPFVAE